MRLENFSLGMVSNDFGVDESPEVKPFDSELGHLEDKLARPSKRGGELCGDVLVGSRTLRVTDSGLTVLTSGSAVDNAKKYWATPSLTETVLGDQMGWLNKTNNQV